MALHCPDPLVTVTGFFDGISPQKLETLADVYSPGVEFREPLHETRGIAALRGVYERLFQQLDDISIAVTDVHGDDSTGFLAWTMRYQLRGRPRVIQGTTYVKFAQDGRVAVQNDYWDASFPVYGEFPGIGWVMRWIRKRVTQN